MTNPQRRQQGRQPGQQAKAERPAVTPAAEWGRKAQQGELYRLPGSGHTVRLRRPGLTALAAEVGHIPNPLAREVVKLMSAASKPETEADRLEAYLQSARAYVAVAELCFVEPRVVSDRVPDYAAGEIAPADIPSQDLVWLYWTFLESDAAMSAPFRVKDVDA